MYLCLTISLWMSCRCRCRRRFPRADLHHPARLRSRRLLPVATGQQYSRQPVQPDDPDALCVLAKAARAAPRFVEQPGPAGRERSRHLFLVHDRTEYVRLGRWQQRLYRLSRHPIVSHLILPPAVFLLLYRIPFDGQGAGGMNVARSTSRIWLWRACSAGLGLAIGFGRVLAVQLPIMVVASILGVWLFSVQHRFEHTLWVHDANWSFTKPRCAGRHTSGCPHPTMVHRKYRFPSYPPPQSAHSQLPARGLPRRDRRHGSRADPDAAHRHQHTALRAVG